MQIPFFDYKQVKLTPVRLRSIFFRELQQPLLSVPLRIPSLPQCPSESFPPRTKSVRTTTQPGVSQGVGHGASQRIRCLIPYTSKSLSQETTCSYNFVVKASSPSCFLQRFSRGFRPIFPGGSGGFRRVPGGSESRSVNLGSLWNIAKRSETCAKRSFTEVLARGFLRRSWVLI